ncbi:Uncharacterised protein [Mycobacteroides abscessus subsp. abscessus]|nr:Uncharacterised protein [Mycobacteroides abscessus subsp. abscessus]
MRVELTCRSEPMSGRAGRYMSMVRGPRATMAPSTVMSHARPRRVAGGETEPAGVRSVAGSSTVVLPGALVTSVLSARTWQNLPFPNKCELRLTQSVKSPLPSRRRHRPHYRPHQRRRTFPQVARSGTPSL